MIINIIEKICCQADLSTFDPYDIWQTKIGYYIKKLYNSYKYLLLPFAGILTLWDIFIINEWRIGYRKKEYPIVRALSTLSLINVYKKQQNPKALEYCRRHVDWLLDQSNELRNGIGWGLPFNWAASKEIVYSENTPFSTHTPYIFEAIYHLNIISPNKKYYEAIERILRFYEYDLKIIYEDESKMAISYGPFYDRVAINATSYAMLMYSYFLKIFPEKKDYYMTKIRKFYGYLEYHQGVNGEWYYSPEKTTSFIDCFHSCFIIQNLIKSQIIVPDIIDDSLINNGWLYLKKDLFDHKKKLFKRFSIKNKPGIIKFDLYDNAEALHTAILLKDEYTISILKKSISKFFHIKEDIYSAITIFNLRKNKNMLRWATLPLLYAYSLEIIKNDVRPVRSNK